VIRIATRKSPLALWQARWVGDALSALHPGLQIQLLERTTRGDRILDQALSKVGGKDLFVKEIENALVDREAQVAVHSLKDVPTEIPEELHIAAYPIRADPRDALVSNEGYTVDTLPDGARVGTSSLRRAAQLRARRPDLDVVPIRGNVQTRLRKLEEEGLAATVLALAGLDRLGLADLASQILDPAICLPAIGQGILAVETRKDDAHTNALVAPLDDAASRAAALAERAFLARLHGGCQIPIAGHATVAGELLRLEGLVASLDGTEIYRDTIAGSVADAARLGIELADTLIGRGANRVLDALRGVPPSAPP